MPFELSWGPGRLYRRYHGALTGADIVASLQRLCGDPRFDEVRVVVDDYRDVESLVVSDEDAALIAAMQIGARFTNPNLTIASVASDPALIAEVQRLVALFQPTLNAPFHATVADAHRWLERRDATNARYA